MRRRTIDEIKLIVEERGYLFLEDGKSGNHGERKVIIKDETGYKYDVLLNHLMDEKRRINPFDKGNPYTLENIKIWLKIHDKRFILNDGNVYQGNAKLLSFYCFDCNESFVCRWGNICQGAGCSVCEGHQISPTTNFGYRSPELLLDWSNKNTLNPFEINISYKKDVYWKCHVCEYEWKDSVDKRFHGLNGNITGCPSCKGKVVSDKNRLSITNPELVSEWHPTLNGDLKPKDVSYGSGKNIWWKCDTCGYEWETKIAKRASRGDGCGVCAGRVLTDKNRLSILFPKLCEEWDKVKNGELIPENFSFGMNNQVWWICSKCGNSWKTSINSRAGVCKTNCRFCADVSKGNTKVREFLLNNNIKFIPEYKIKECKNILPLPFDFYLTDYKILIEYDGLIHFKDVFNDPDNFLKVQLRDKIKTRFCIDNNINLLRIKYTKFNKIDEILTKELGL